MSPEGGKGPTDQKSADRLSAARAGLLTATPPSFFVSGPYERGDPTTEGCFSSRLPVLVVDKRIYVRLEYSYYLVPDSSFPFPHLSPHRFSEKGTSILLGG